MLPNRALVSCCSMPATDQLTAWQNRIYRMFILTVITAVFLLLGVRSFSQTVVMMEVNGKPYKAGKAVLFGQPAVNLDQAGNGKYDAVQNPMQWQNGNLNPNQAHYIEHHSIPYRLIMTDMPVGTEVTLTMNFDFVNSKKYAIDFLTGYQQLQPHNYINHSTEETVNPLAPAALSAPTSQLDIPAPSYLNAAALNDFNTLADVDARKISIWGANFNTAASIVFTPDANILVLDNANKKVAWTVKFTPTSSTVTLAWGGHIASRDDWGFNAGTGEPNSAGGIQGSPYHMRTQGWSLGNIGNQDRSLQTALAGPTCPTSLIPSGNTTITLNPDNGHYEICPNTPATFSVGTQPAGTTYSWSVTGDATGNGPTNQPNFTIVTAKHCGSFTVSVQIANGSGFVANCSVTVYVVDAIRPTISLNGVDQGIDGKKVDTKECDQSFPILSGLTYFDNCNADIAASGGVSETDWMIDNTHGDTTINGVEYCYTQRATKIWTVTDYCNNKNTFTYIIYSFDTKPPFISGLSSSDAVQCNTTPDFGTPQVGDNCDPKPTLTSSDSQEDMGNCVTKYIRTWNATDWCGNAATPVVQYFLIRNDKDAPTIGIEANKNLGCNPGNIAFDDPVPADNCGTPTAVQGYPVTGDVVIDGCNRTQTKTWKYQDACGNIGTGSQTLHWVVDTEAPIVTSGNSFSKDLGCNPSEINGNFVTPQFDGGCSQVQVTGPTLVSEVTEGCNQSRTWKWVATDCSNLSTTVTQTLTWKFDHDAPVITTDGKGGDLGCNPTADAINAALGGATANDHCDGSVQVAVSNSEVTGDCNKSQTRTFTATDACGNSSSTSVT
ncbi:MAG: hypothetical protein HYR66_10455, partial [Sphingobacteriales bacterium]|nr:hypothetical protein [Sphingobacteriales bacterium]